MATHRRIASESAAGPSRRLRPLSILSPPNSPGLKDFDSVPTEFGNIVKDLELRKEKLYYEGYLLKLDDLSVDGQPVSERAWTEVYASLSGTIISTWPATAADDADTRGIRNSVTPTFLNITDARFVETPQPGDIAISTAGRNRFVLRAPNSGDGLAAQRWLVAIRLAMFERARLQEIYTANLFLKFSSKDIIEYTKRDEKWSGLVDVRVTGLDTANNQWSRMWCSIVDTGTRKGILHKISNKDPDEHRPQVFFYASKKDKSAVISMSDIFSAYCTYPEHLSLIESAGIIKLEGDIHSSSPGVRNNASGFALIIPVVSDSTRRLSGAGQPPSGQSLIPNILRFLHNIWSCFELYNKPNHLMLNMDHVDAMGVATTSPDLNQDQLLGRLPGDLRNENQWRKALRQQSVLNGHYTQVRGKPLTPDSPKSSGGFFRRKGSDRRVVSESAIIPKPKPLVTTIEEDEEFRQRSLVKDAPQIEPFLYDSPSRLNVGSKFSSHDQDDLYTRSVLADAQTDPARSAPKPLVSPLEERPEPLTRMWTDTTVASTTMDAQSLIASPVRRPLIEDSDEERPDSAIGARSEYNAYRGLPARLISRDSQRSYRSEASTYSDGLDPSALDLVQQTPQLGAPDDAPSLRARDDREGSLYSVEHSDYGSIIGEAPVAWDKESLDEREMATRVRRRSKAAELLGLPRTVEWNKADNPYVRERMRSTRYGGALGDGDEDDGASGPARHELGRAIDF